MLCTSCPVLPASGEKVFLPDILLLCISIPNSDCLFFLSVDQVVKGEREEQSLFFDCIVLKRSGPAGPASTMTVKSQALI